MKALLVALAIAHGADAVTTVTAIQRGAHEGNPLLPSQPAAIVAVISAETVGQIWLLARLARTHPTAARTLALVAIGVESGAAGWNTHVTVTLHARRR